MLTTDFRGATPEPIEESIEVAYLSGMRRFREVIYPTLFEPFGYSEYEAHTIWLLNGVRSDVDELRLAIERLRELL